MVSRSPEDGHFGDDDRMSILSLSSEEQESYEVERILAEEFEQGQEIFLVKWKGYETHRSTWEPRDSFDSDETLKEWERQKLSGDFLDAQQVDALQIKMNAYVDEKEDRRHQRELKKLGKNKQNAPQTRMSFSENSDGGRPLVGEKKNTTLAKDAQQLIPMLQSPSSRPRDFHGIDAPARARRTTQVRQPRPADSSDPRAGRLFRNLSHAYNFNKKTRSEIGPDPSLLKLKPIAQLMRPEKADIALNLPAVDNRLIETRPEESRRSAIPETRPLNIAPQRDSEPKPGKWIAPGLEGPQRTAWWAGNGREPKKEDLIGELHFGAHPVGKVRYVGVQHPLRSELIRTKPGDYELPILFEQEHVFNFDEYKEIVTGLSNDVSYIVWIDPYNATAPNAFSLAQYLEENRAVGFWFPTPEMNSTQMMVLYVPSDTWSFLERGHPMALRSRLQIAVRNKIPTHLLPLNNPGNAVPASPAEMNYSYDDFSETALPVQQPGLLQLTSAASVESLQEPQLDPTLVGNLTPNRKKSAKASNSNEAINKEDMTSPILPLCSATVLDVEARGIKYDRITRLNPNKKFRYNPSKARFYLSFTDANELAILRDYLSKHTLPTLIYTNDNDHGWETFKETLGISGANVGVIFFHGDCYRFDSVPGLGRLLRDDFLNVFRVSLKKPLEDCPNPHLDRLFPSGTVVLITEGSMLTDPAATLSALQWFAAGSKAKPNWKLMVRPNIDQFLRQVADVSPDDLKKGLIEILAMILRVQPSLNSALTGVESDLESLHSEEDLTSQKIISPCHIPGHDDLSIEGEESKRRDRRLLEYFAGWAIVNARRFRRFQAISAVLPENPILYHHIEFFSLPAFLSATSASKKPTSKSS